MLKGLTVSATLMATVYTAATSSAHGQTRIPPGCFVTDEERGLYITPPTCYNESRSTVLPYTPDSGYSNEALYQMYGFQFGFEVINGWDLFYKWKGAESNSSTHYKWYVTEFNKNKKLKALEKKLRRACGSKCRKIATVSSLSQRGEQPTARIEGEGTLLSPDMRFEDFVAGRMPK
jgi:hypothetical protein